uniref:Uncharacterized protein n=1 Tax=Candidatus Kentrum sp. MB TaxID=2138164 RepID=A0A450XUF8_9GAMM|nr:MAG: hypothetical protein BECKMB1821G_GA0114241_10339 [Candidatus Kentron sp. MB]VFK32912.1 MAG: hypothetical protein BECKMB1821I_GA0114274_10388 [Candidatus Kentron sp. MB]VFK75799.1 MAG: hypothetical protein BECKMB1821H_GA0114242_10328 [Candidatus Kentron sp. MB]
MPQFFAAIIGLGIVVYVIAFVVWIVQWIWAAIVFVWEAFLMPFLIYLTPSILMLITTVAFYWGGWIAAQNYFSSLKTKVYWASTTGKFTQNYVMSVLTIFLILISLSFAVSFVVFTYEPVRIFAQHVIEYYESIKFPSFDIHFPFWE